MTKRPQDTSAEEPDGGNPHIRFRGGPRQGDRPGLLNRISHFGALAYAAAALLVGVAIGTAYGESKRGVRIPHGKPADFNWVALPEFGGREAVIYRSPDGRRVAAAFEESGKESFTYPFDEFLMVTAGTVKIKVHGGETLVLSKGDVAYIPEGSAVDFEFSKDFADITCLTADHVVKWR